MKMYDLSIVIPTVNRAKLLWRNLKAIRSGVSSQTEVIVVDGASTDETGEVLRNARDLFGEDLKVIREPCREGFVKAANKGFRAAQGRNMTWLNDDAWALPGSLDSASTQIDQSSKNVGFVAMFHNWHSTRNIAYEIMYGTQTYRLCHVRGTLYANFAVGQRKTFEKLGHFDEQYFLYAADPDLSLKAWHAGLWVEPAENAFIDHDEHEDARRESDSSRGKEDNAKLFAKWDLPPKNEKRNDFDPARSCTLLGLRQTTAAHAA